MNRACRAHGKTVRRLIDCPMCNGTRISKLIPAHRRTLRTSPRDSFHNSERSARRCPATRSETCEGNELKGRAEGAERYASERRSSSNVVWDARLMRTASIATSSTLATIAALHVGWGCGASFPFHDRGQLADSVAGSSVTPGSRDCLAVAGLLACAAALVADVLPFGTTVRRAGVLGVALVLAGRGAVGVAGCTGSIVPWTPSARFNDLDKRYYGPLCLLLSGGAVLSVR